MRTAVATALHPCLRVCVCLLTFNLKTYFHGVWSMFWPLLEQRFMIDRLLGCWIFNNPVAVQLFLWLRRPFLLPQQVGGGPPRPDNPADSLVQQRLFGIRASTPVETRSCSSALWRMLFVCFVCFSCFVSRNDLAQNGALQHSNLSWLWACMQPPGKIYIYIYIHCSKEEKLQQHYSHIRAGSTLPPPLYCRGL